MNDKVYIYATGEYSAAAEELSSHLNPLVKNACGKGIRRVDRLTQLTLLGATNCVKNITLPNQTGLYLSSLYGAFNNSREVFTELYQDQEIPSPLRFINTVGNAASFHVANHLALQAPSMFISQSYLAVQRATQLACMDIRSRKISAALTGVVSEAGQPLSAYRKRLPIKPQQAVIEGAWFFLLANNLPNHQPIAEITAIKEFDQFDELTDFLQETMKHAHHSVTLSNISQQHSLEIQTACKQITVISDYNPSNQFIQFPEAVSFLWFLNKNETGTHYCHIGRSNGEHWNVTLLKKTR